ncbi:TlpA family protein disulfide reductase [Neolewinella persica]|uniref:TlpA family protein disulfide reductase n=1 Tax=Neolewinella persica TaxID=70998 RepID=UPI0003657751|nr:TlpA disulfide reductase family protein [Neolewinella persica]
MPGRKFWIPLLLLAAYFGGRAWYFSPNVSSDEFAKDFTAIRADGKSFTLTELRGNYVLLDFWGSWCGPCRRESPGLVQLHETMGDQLIIVSVAIERDSTAWQRALIQDKKTWPYQVMDYTKSFKFLGGNIAGMYGVKQVPTNFLIDPDTGVVGVNVPLDEIPHLIGIGASGAPTSHNTDL